MRFINLLCFYSDQTRNLRWLAAPEIFLCVFPRSRKNIPCLLKAVDCISTSESSTKHARPVRNRVAMCARCAIGPRICRSRITIFIWDTRILVDVVEVMMWYSMALKQSSPIIFGVASLMASPESNTMLHPLSLFEDSMQVVVTSNPEHQYQIAISDGFNAA